MSFLGVSWNDVLYVGVLGFLKVFWGVDILYWDRYASDMRDRRLAFV